MPKNKVLALYDAQKSVTDDAEIVYHGCVKKTDIIVKNSELTFLCNTCFCNPI